MENVEHIDGNKKEQMIKVVDRNRTWVCASVRGSVNITKFWCDAEQSLLHAWGRPPSGTSRSLISFTWTFCRHSSYLVCNSCSELASAWLLRIIGCRQSTRARCPASLQLVLDGWMPYSLHVPPSVNSLVHCYWFVTTHVAVWWCFEGVCLCVVW